MNTGRLWQTAGILVVVALLFMSCGPQVAPPPTTTPAPAAPAPAAPRPAPTPAPTPVPSLVEKPMYGGTINVLQRTITENFDGGVTPNALAPFQFGLIYEHLIFPDWSVGMAGSGKHDFGGGLNRLEYFTGHLAEKYEIPEIGKWIFQIRKGVRFALDPTNEASRLMNGRELTADDVIWSQRRLLTLSTSSVMLSQPALAKTAILEKTGPWEVTLKTPEDPMAGWHWIAFGGNSGLQYPREVVEKYGSTSDWRNVVGTGPFMLKDFVAGSVATLVRNPNYWGKDPVGAGKGNQLPYADTVKILIIPDLSTRLASMRTGRAEWVDAIEWEDATSFMKTAANIQYKKYLPGGRGVALRTDKPDLPFKDKRVRQALMLATDFEALKRDLYLGEAEIHINPVAPVLGYGRAYMPMNELPESVQSLYKHNPEKAKQLLAEAGYPRGFKTKMIVQNISTDMDPAAAFKAMWAKAGIDVEIQPRETAVYTGITRARSHDEMIMTGVGSSGGTASFYYMTSWRSARSASYIDDPIIEQKYQEMQKYVMVNFAKADEIFRELTPHMIEQAYYIPRPTPYSYIFWQPWLKNYHGETLIYHFLYYAWIDQDLKEKTTGRR